MPMLTYFFTGNPLSSHQLLFAISGKGCFTVDFPKDRMAHITVFDRPIVGHWFEQKIAQAVYGSTYMGPMSRIDGMIAITSNRFQMWYLIVHIMCVLHSATHNNQPCLRKLPGADVVVSVYVYARLGQRKWILISKLIQQTDTAYTNIALPSHPVFILGTLTGGLAKNDETSKINAQAFVVSSLG